MWEEAQEGQRVDGILVTSSQGLGDLGHVGFAVNVFLLSLFALQHFNSLSVSGRDASMVGLWVGKTPGS